MAIGFYVFRDELAKIGKDDGDKFHVVTAAAINAYSAPFYVAQNMGFWEKEGLTVEDKYFTSGRLALDALLAGGADLITVAETPIVFAAFSGQNVGIVATISSATNDLKVLARRDKGIERPEDLRGKRIGMLFGATSEYYANLFLQAYGISFNDIQRVNLNPADMPLALVKGDIDAYVIWEPFVNNGFRKLGPEKAIRFVKKDIYTLPFNLAVRKDFAAEQPDVVVRAIRALIAADAFIRANPDVVIPLVAKKIGMDESMLKEIWPDYTFDVSLTMDLMSALKRQAEWAKSIELVPATSTMPNFRDFVLPKFLLGIDPQRVSLDP